jgi:hypothetical protein
MRDAFIIFFGIILAMAIGSYLYFNGTPSVSPPVGPVLVPDAPFSVLAEGQDSGTITRRTNFRIQTEEDFIELWRMVYGTGGPARPPVDFSKREVLAVFDGTHSTGGYDVAVTDIKDENGRRVIYLRRTSPGDTCNVTPAITSPFKIISVSKSTLPITREEEEVVTQCR